jgi:hypothetical protein
MEAKAIGCYNLQTRLWNWLPQTAAPVAWLRTSDGQLWTASSDNNLRQYDIEQRQAPLVLPSNHTRPPTTLLALTARGADILVSASDDRCLCAWQLPGTSLSPQVLHAGWLAKLSKGLVRRWLRRWCVLTANAFEYREAVEGAPLGSILFEAIQQVRASEVKEFAFEIVTAARTYTLSAGSQAEYEPWLAQFPQRAVVTETAGSEARAIVKWNEDEPVAVFLQHLELAEFQGGLEALGLASPLAAWTVETSALLALGIKEADAQRLLTSLRLSQPPWLLFISAAMAQQLLAGTEPSTWLIRPSSSQAGLFVLCVVKADGGVLEILCPRSPTGLLQVEGDNAFFPTLTALVAFYRREGVLGTAVVSTELPAVAPTARPDSDLVRAASRLPQSPEKAAARTSDAQPAKPREREWQRVVREQKDAAEQRRIAVLESFKAAVNPEEQKLRREQQKERTALEKLDVSGLSLDDLLEGEKQFYQGTGNNRPASLLRFDPAEFETAVRRLQPTLVSLPRAAWTAAGTTRDLAMNLSLGLQMVTSL